MTFQEIHVSDNTLSVINTQFQACYSLWTCHCGLVTVVSSLSVLLLYSLIAWSVKTIGLSLQCLCVFLITRTLCPPPLPVNNVNSYLIMSLTYYTIKIWTSNFIIFSLLGISTTLNYVLICHHKYHFSGSLS